MTEYDHDELRRLFDLVLAATTDARDTDFMAKLIVVKPDGMAFNLVDGVIRARYREGFEDEERASYYEQKAKQLQPLQ